MPISPEITSIFAMLATSLQTPNPTAGIEIDQEISNLNRELNRIETPGTDVLDAALSLMGFNAPQVYDSVTECTLRAIITVLRSSIECKMLRIDGGQFLRVGGSICRSDCASVMRWCNEILRKLEERKEFHIYWTNHCAAGDLCVSVLYAVVKLAAFAPPSQHTFPSISSQVKFGDDRASSLSSMFHLVNKYNIKDGEVPVRLLLWHLDPMLLKHDISQMLHEVTERPFISLSTEMYERMEWRSIIICMVISPSIFVETRALLHNWFLVTGLASIMELETEFVAQVLDIISRPMRWGISKEVGTRLPFSQAYFPSGCQLLRNLAGPLTQEYFQNLLNKLNLSVSHTEGNIHKISNKSATKNSMVDHKSMWSMAMNFPGWISFASVLLFFSNSSVDTSHSGCIPFSSKPCVLHDAEVPCSMAAARYISWILNPISKSGQDVLFNYLCEVSELWIQKYTSSSQSNEQMDSSTIGGFLKEMNDMYVMYFRPKVGFPVSIAKGLEVQQSLLLTRITLGTLIGYPNYMNASGCGMLLHYAATGLIQKFPVIESTELQQRRQKCGQQCDSLMWIEQYTEAEAIAGCRVVFDTTDDIENMSLSWFESEEEGLNFIYQVKVKMRDYLFKCVKRLLQLELGRVGLHIRRDLRDRVLRWRHQGKDVVLNMKDFDKICDSLNMQRLH